MKNIQYIFLMLIFIVLITGFYFWNAKSGFSKVVMGFLNPESELWNPERQNYLSVCNDTNKLIEATVFLGQLDRDGNRETKYLDLKPNRCKELSFNYNHWGKVHVKSRNSDYQIESSYDVFFSAPGISLEESPQRYEFRLAEGEW